MKRLPQPLHGDFRLRQLSLWMNGNSRHVVLASPYNDGSIWICPSSITLTTNLTHSREESTEQAGSDAAIGEAYAPLVTCYSWVLVAPGFEEIMLPVLCDFDSAHRGAAVIQDTQVPLRHCCHFEGIKQDEKQNQECRTQSYTPARA